MDKGNVIRELPTEIVQHRNTSDELIAELKRDGLIIESTAFEVPADENLPNSTEASGWRDPAAFFGG